MSAAALPSSEWATCNNPDYFALLLSRVHAELDDSDRPFYQTVAGTTVPDDKLVKRYAPVLNSLAPLLLYEKAQQPVAVAFKPARAYKEEPPAFILAQDATVQTKIQDRLRSLLDHLREVRDLHEAARGSHSPLDLNKIKEEEALERAKLMGELDALYHSRNRIEARFKKDRRYEHFLNLVADARGQAADHRTDLDEHAQRQLKDLQELSDADHKPLLLVGEMIEGSAISSRHRGNCLEKKSRRKPTMTYS